jgi:tetratricopeptide (TPR) repeat protein
MKKIAVLSLSALVFAGCSQPAQPTTNINTNSTNAVVRTSNDTSVVSSHGSTPSAPPANSNGKPPAPPSGNSPMAKAIDVSKFNQDIEKAEKEFKAKPSDAKAKEALAQAYFARAFALNGAAQYRSALGDFRKSLKLDPNNQDARAMHDQIITIFKSLDREPPKEGEEPPPMPFEKEAAKS